MQQDHKNLVCFCIPLCTFVSFVVSCSWLQKFLELIRRFPEFYDDLSRFIPAG